MKRSLEGIEGVTEVEVSHKDNKAWVTVDRTVTDEALEEAVRKAGRFTGKVISRKPAEPSPDR